MTSQSPNSRYVIISPVRDEVERIRVTLEAVCNQSQRPEQWIIVDDGSKDGTDQIILKYAQRCDWIRLVRLARCDGRRLGAEIQAFNTGYELVDKTAEFVVKLDGDVDLPSSYFERLVREFQADPGLGIASGLYLERTEDEWKPVALPYYHVAGASKMVRAACFRDINGFIPHPAWDTVDEIRAWSKGWKTRHFPDLRFYHLRSEGSAPGQTRRDIVHGEIYYLTGGSTPFFIAKLLHRAVNGRPFMLGGLAMLCGYMKARLTHSSKLVSEREEQLYRRVLNERLLQRWRALAQ